ncbi:glycosyltransferase [Luteococcus sp.]|uniref:glycosyltransferase n=1 Tax=Luteococcus sp. TaxID=1969402 RepID=UPI003736350E
MTALVVGHTRFSLVNPNSPAWLASNGSSLKDVDSYRSYLFSDERLQPRLDLFCDHSVPMLRHAAETHDLRHIVSLSDTMPVRFKDQLKDLAADNPWLVIDEKREGLGPLWPRDHGRDVLGSRNEVFATYRLDDDDLLAWDFFDRFMPFVTKPNVGMMVSGGLGATGIYDGGTFYSMKTAHKPMIAIGLMAIWETLDGGTRGPASVSHHESDRGNPVIIDSRRPSWLWTRHATQDTALSYHSTDRQEVIQQLRDTLAPMEVAPDPVLLDELFPTLAGRLLAQAAPDDGTRQSFSGPFDAATEPHRLELDPLEGRIHLSARASTPPGAGDRNALLSFKLTRLDSQDFDPAAVDLTGTGMVLSARAVWGFYTYVPSNGENRTIDRSFTIPEGYQLSAIELHQLATDRPTTSVEVLTVQELH